MLKQHPPPQGRVAATTRSGQPLQWHTTATPTSPTATITPNPHHHGHQAPKKIGYASDIPYPWWLYPIYRKIWWKPLSFRILVYTRIIPYPTKTEIFFEMLPFGQFSTNSGLVWTSGSDIQSLLQGNSVTYTRATSVMKAVRLKLYHTLIQFRKQIFSKKGLNFDSEMQQKLV